MANRPEQTGEAPPDLRVTFGEAPPWSTAEARIWYEHPERDPHGAPLLTCSEPQPGCLELRYSDDTRFYLEQETSALWVTWPDSLTSEYAATYLLGPIFGFLLRLRGHVCLHAASVRLSTGCVAFAGTSGSGKSTLAAAFAQRGASVLSDDVSCLLPRDDGIWIQPGYPLIRLWDESARLIETDPESLPLLCDGWGKRYLSLTGSEHRFHEHPEVLKAIFVLAARRAMTGPAELRRLGGQEILNWLLGNTYGHYLLDRAMRAREFEVLGRLARAVPVYELALNARNRNIAEACAWIEARL